MAHGYPSESTPIINPMNTNMTRFRGFFKNLCIIVLWMKVASALEAFKFISPEQIPITVAANKQRDIHQIDRPTKAKQFSLFCNPFIRPASLILPPLAFG